MLSVFRTNHERTSKMNELKEGKVTGIDIYEREKKLIKLMIKKNRPQLKALKEHKFFL